MNFNDCLTFKIKEEKNNLENDIAKEINSNIFDNLDKNFDKNEIKNYNIDSNNIKQKDWGQIKSDFQKDIESYKNIITINFVDINIEKIFTTSQNNILESLKKEKSKISENLKSKNWKKIQEDFEKVIRNETEILKTNLLDNLHLLSQNVKDNYTKAYKIINEYKNVKNS